MLLLISSRWSLSFPWLARHFDSRDPIHLYGHVVGSLAFVLLAASIADPKLFLTMFAVVLFADSLWLGHVVLKGQDLRPFTDRSTLELTIHLPQDLIVPAIWIGLNVATAMVILASRPMTWFVEIGLLALLGNLLLDYWSTRWINETSEA